MVLPCRCDWGEEGELHATPEILRVLPQSGSEEAQKDHVVIQVVPRVTDGYVPEDTVARPQDAIYTGPHLLP